MVPIGTALSLRILRVIRRGAHAMYTRGAAVTPLGRDGGRIQLVANRALMTVAKMQGHFWGSALVGSEGRRGRWGTPTMALHTYAESRVD